MKKYRIENKRKFARFMMCVVAVFFVTCLLLNIIRFPKVYVSKCIIIGDAKAVEYYSGELLQ